MKTLFLTLITSVALTDLAQARDWMWFHGDIGLGSPFLSSRTSKIKHTTQTAPQLSAKRTPSSKERIVKGKSKSTDHRVSAR
jgi:hypothetical protein